MGIYHLVGIVLLLMGVVDMLIYANYVVEIQQDVYMIFFATHVVLVEVLQLVTHVERQKLL